MAKLRTMIDRFLGPRTPKRTDKEVEAELQHARLTHAKAIEAKDAVLVEFRSFEKLLAQRR